MIKFRLIINLLLLIGLSFVMIYYKEINLWNVFLLIMIIINLCDLFIKNIRKSNK